MNVAINGFGRIGRSAFKALLERRAVKVVAINDLTDPAALAHLLTWDSCYGRYGHKVLSGSDYVAVDNIKYPIYAQKDPAALPWKKLKVDVVIEATGFFTNREGASAHIRAGARKVIISAPAKGGEVPTIVLGVNEEIIKIQDKILSMASCTTNCLAPVTAVINREIGIKKAIMSTVHSYTADQNLVDGPHKDWRRARAAAINIVPTTTGAAVAVTETLPVLKNKFDGLALRVPTAVGSIADMTFLLARPATVEQINKILTKASQSSRLKGILAVTNDPVVSSDIVGNPASSIVDLPLTKVVAGDLAKIVSWYDNEWGYANRLADLCVCLAKKKLL